MASGKREAEKDDAEWGFMEGRGEVAYEIG